MIVTTPSLPGLGFIPGIGFVPVDPSPHRVDFRHVRNQKRERQIREAFSSRNFSGIGLGRFGLGDCPSFAPYTDAAGGCTNVAPGTSTDPGSFGQPVQPPPSQQPYTGYGYGQMPTGNIDAGALDSTYAAAQAKANAAQAQGATLGVPTTCSVYSNSSPYSPTLYGTDCTVNGNPGNDAGLLLEPGGFKIAVAGAAQGAGQPLTSYPNLVFPTAPSNTPPPTTQAQASSATNKPNQSVPPQNPLTPMPTNVPNTGGSMYSTSTPSTAPTQTGSGPSDLLTQVEGMFTTTGGGINPLILLAGGGLLLFMMMGSKR